MGRKSRGITDAELQVLEALWQGTELTTREIAQEVYGRQRASDAASVLKLLERLEAKDLVARDRETGRNRFRALVARDDLAGRELRDMAKKLCGGSLTPLLTQLVEGEDLTAEERDALRALLDRDDDLPGKKGGSR